VCGELLSVHESPAACEILFSKQNVKQAHGLLLQSGVVKSGRKCAGEESLSICQQRFQTCQYFRNVLITLSGIIYLHYKVS